MLEPSSLNWTFFTPKLSVAVPEIVTVPDMVELLLGEVNDTEGGKARNRRVEIVIRPNA